MIPKKIHYVWVGNKPKPELVERCIASWKTYCPDYEIIQWGNAALARIDNAYVQEAAAEGKWAFVSDYLRLLALYEQGGFYCDSDLEVTASLEQFRAHDFVTGFEKTLDGKRTRPITALMGAIKGDRVIEGLLREYDGIHFMNGGVPDMTPNTDRITRYFRREFGLSRYNGGEETVDLDERRAIYPYYYFCTPKPGAKNFSIHHFNGSWIEPGKKKIVFALGAWQLQKFSFEKGANAGLPLREDERLVWKLPVGGSRERTYVLVRKSPAPR